MTHFDLEAPASASTAPAEIVRVMEKENKVGGEGEGSVAVDIETGDEKVDKDCRICHLSLEHSDLDSDPASASDAIVLGCSCKDDLAAAHKHCAEAWFKIKGNKTCEICGAVARNVTGPIELEVMEHWSEQNDSTPPPPPAPQPTETPNFWRGHRFLNFLLACMVFAFVISWLFHFNVHLRDT